MAELTAIDKQVQPDQVYLVVDGMTGQDAVKSAKGFNDALELDGCIMTKLDGDARGGAALSVKHVTGTPIKFIGTGEKMEDFEAFHPDRMAGRILGMGDVVSLVEKAREEVDEQEAEALAERMAKGQFTMHDFLKQLKSVRRMGNMKQLLGMLPGVGKMLKDIDVDEKQFDRIEAIAGSMTDAERDDVSLMNKSRARRVARGAGTNGSEVNKLLKQFDMVKKMSKQMTGGGVGGRMKAARNLTSGGDMQDLAAMGLGGRGSTRTQSSKSGFKRRKKRK